MGHHQPASFHLQCKRSCECASTLAQALSLISWACRSSWCIGCGRNVFLQKMTRKKRPVSAPSFSTGFCSARSFLPCKIYWRSSTAPFSHSKSLHLYRAIIGGSQTWIDNLVAIVINLLLAAYFWNILKVEWRTLTETENFRQDPPPVSLYLDAVRSADDGLWRTTGAGLRLHIVHWKCARRDEAVRPLSTRWHCC